MRLRSLPTAAFVAWLACGCTAPPPAVLVAPPPPVATAAVVPSTTPQAAAPSDPCALFDPGKLGIYGTVYFDVSDVAPRPAGFRSSARPWCLPTPSGAWGIVFDIGASTWQLAHASTPGTLAVAGKPSSVSDQHYEYRITVLNDYDGDAEPEVFVAQDGMSRLSPPVHYRTLYTWRRGAPGDAGSVVEYPAARELALGEMRDADKDGRMDFGLVDPFPGKASGGFFAGSLVQPTLLAHALPDGTFSFRDAVARADLLRQCPRSTVTKRDFEGEDFAPAIESVVCAVYWRVPPAVLEAQIKRACAGRSDCEGVLALATQTPPFTLP